MINDTIIDEDWLRQVSVCTDGTSLVDTHIKKGFKKTPKEVLLFDELTHDERLWIVLRDEFIPSELMYDFARFTGGDIISHFLSSFCNSIDKSKIFEFHDSRWYEIYNESQDLKNGITRWSVVEDKCWRETSSYIKSNSNICNAVIGMYFSKTVKFFTKKTQKDKQIEQLINLIEAYDKENKNEDG